MGEDNEKKLIILNGTTGVGKTETSRLLLKQLDRAVFLDGDWCWMMDPFIVNEENKRMVEQNITYLLRNFLKNSSLDHVIFCWVMQYEWMFDLLLKELEDLDFNLHKFTLICSEKALRHRIQKDIEAGIRTGESLAPALERLPLYEEMDTVKVDTSLLTKEEAATIIIETIYPENAG